MGDILALCELNAFYTTATVIMVPRTLHVLFSAGRNNLSFILPPMFSVHMLLFFFFLSWLVFSGLWLFSLWKQTAQIQAKMSGEKKKIK